MSYSSYSYYDYDSYSSYGYYDYYYGSYDSYDYMYTSDYGYDYDSWNAGYYDYYYGSNVENYGDSYGDYGMNGNMGGDDTSYPGLYEGAGNNMDSTWYQVNSWGMDWLNTTCAINADCNGRDIQCCVSILVTDAEGWEEQAFRCMTSGMVEADVAQEHQMDDGTYIEFTMKCLDSGSAYIRAGILATMALIVSVTI
jgi:hypothetical protein